MVWVHVEVIHIPCVVVTLGTQKREDSLLMRELKI